MGKILNDVFVFYLECLPMLIAFHFAKRFSNGVSLLGKLQVGLYSGVVIAIALLIFTGTDENGNKIQFEWWHSYLLTSYFFKCLIASWIGIVIAKKEKTPK